MAISWDLLFIGGTFFLAGVVKGATGMGLPTVAMGVLGTAMPPLAAASLLLVPSFVTNIWQLFAGPSFGAIIRRLWPMMLGILLGTLAGSQMLVSGDTQLTTGALGAALVLYAGYMLSARQISIPVASERWLSPLVGLITGIVTGGTGVFVIPAVPYLQALGFNKDDLVQALGLSFTVSTVALSIALLGHGGFDLLWPSILAVAPALLGMWFGQTIRHRISPQTFRRWFLICLLVLGVELFLRPIL